MLTCVSRKVTVRGDSRACAMLRQPRDGAQRAKMDHQVSISPIVSCQGIGMRMGEDGRVS